jgi:pSer/pThr/pTyr-binding forkhead associated (FHA) protein
VYAKGKQDDKARLVATHPIATLEVSVGRQRPGEPLPDIDVTNCDEEHFVSAPHLNLLLRGDQLLVVDLASKNGTWLNRQQLAPSVPHPLKPGDELVLGLGVALKVLGPEGSDAHPPA